MLSLYNSPKIHKAARKFRLTQKLAYTSSDLTWDLLVATAHVYIDQFQVLHRNDRTPKFRSYVRFVNEAQWLSEEKSQQAKQKKANLRLLPQAQQVFSFIGQWWDFSLSGFS